MSTLNQQASEAVLGQRSELAATLVEREFARHPELVERYGRIGREKSLQDAGYHLSFLAQAVALDNQSLFTDYVAWAKVMLAQRRVLAADLAFHLGCMAEVLEEKLPAEPGALAAGFVRAAVAEMPAMPDEIPTFLDEGEPLTPLAHQYLGALRRGERHVASRLVLDAVAAGTSIPDIYLHVFEPAQHEVGRLWQINQISVAEEHYCTAATQLIMSQLYPQIFAGAKRGITMVATCVSGNIHELGVRMVADLFEMDGWNTFYLGANTPHASVIATVVERHADVLAVSATIPFHIDAIRDLIRAVRQNPACAAVQVLVGGSPFNRHPELWREIGADGFALDAQQAVTMANRLIGERRAA